MGKVRPLVTRVGGVMARLGGQGAIIRNHPYATTQRVHNTEFHKQPEDKYPKSLALQILI